MQKRRIRWAGFFLGMVLLQTVAAEDNVQPLHFYAGQQQQITIAAPAGKLLEWQIETVNGRVVARGSNWSDEHGELSISLSFPELKEGSSVDAFLRYETERVPVTFHAVKILDGLWPSSLGVVFDLPHATADQLRAGGMREVSSPAPKILFSNALPGKDAWQPMPELIVLLPDEGDFPIDLNGQNIQQISLSSARIPGSLSVLYSDKEKWIDRNGSGSYMEVKGTPQLLILSPELTKKLGSSPDVLLLIKSVIQEKYNHAFEQAKNNAVRASDGSAAAATEGR
ncbi:hypothetical protein [Victivallis sp. Marseille-Q1083]|uniref:hypothetical protein n=1 Tax=Victivallis sp. Marseille-Q1083 TaxID=2717288 RepID=UPI00158F32C4|nr:hypothetical protein [Victivallis sp. Marseille-Q1083]